MSGFQACSVCDAHETSKLDTSQAYGYSDMEYKPEAQVSNRNMAACR